MSSLESDMAHELPISHPPTVIDGRPMAVNLMKVKEDIPSKQNRVRQDDTPPSATPPQEYPTPGSTVQLSVVRASPNLVHQSDRRIGRRRFTYHLSLPLVILCAFAVLFVGWDVIVHHVWPSISTGTRHAFLTAWAVVATAATTSAVYLLMRRQQRKLSTTAEQLALLLKSYKTHTSLAKRFDNPHLLHCREVLHCKRKTCPMYDAPGERCWQVVALDDAAQNQQTPKINFQQCLKCKVYRLSCPDGLTELGESFNNLMFLLEEEKEQTQRIRSQMIEKEKMVAIGQMASGIAHEIGNPLSSISSIVQMLKRAGTGDPRAPQETMPPEPISFPEWLGADRDPARTDPKLGTHQLDLIETHIQRISAIVRQLSTLSRPGSEGWDWVDVGQTLDEAIRLISFDRRARQIAIDFKPHETLPRTYGLRSELQQVFINLSLNALDAMPNGGTLSVRADKRRRNIVVSIKDTGSGINPEIGRRVFEPFCTTKQPGQGTGLGLAVSYNIVQKHGGTLDFISTVGEGTVFTVWIPVVDKPPKIG